MKRGVLGCVALLGMLFVGLPSAFAVKEFREEFQKKYVPADAKPEWKATVTEAKCNVCHVPDQEKEVRNAYGQALAKLLKKADKKSKEKIAAALEKVAGEKCKAGDAAAPTFGELIRQGKLPASGQ